MSHFDYRLMCFLLVLHTALSIMLISGIDEMKKKTVDNGKKQNQIKHEKKPLLISEVLIVI